MNSENLSEPVSWNCWLRTLFAACGPMMVFTFIGIVEAQSAVLLPQLRKSDSLISVTPEEETWIASLGVIMAPIAAILAGPLIDAFGRKKGLQYFYFNIGVGFGVMAFARNVYHLYIGRIICGVGTGLEVCTVVYLAEICTEKQRSDLFSTNSAMFASGAVLSSLIGGYLPWPLASLIFSSTCFIFFVLECFIPESPPWLYKTGKKDACIQSLQRLGRSEAQIRQELETLQLATKNDKEKVEFRTFLRPTVWKPFVIMSTFFILHSASGVYDVIFYTVDFVERLGTEYNSLDVSVVLSIFRFLSTATIGVYFRSKVGRKSTLALSAFWMTVALLGIGGYEYLFRDTTISLRPFQWVPIAYLILYMITGVSGMICLPWLMTGEMYPLNVRGTMTGVSYVIGYGSMFLFIKLYYVSIEILQIYGLLFAFSIPSCVTVLFGIYILPETQNKTLFEIEQGFLPRKDRLPTEPSTWTSQCSEEKKESVSD